MKTRIDEIYEDIAGRVRTNPSLFTADAHKNIRVLSEMVQTVNLAKCSLYELDLETKNASGYIMYKLQTEHNIPFGICKDSEFLSTNKGIKIKCKKVANISCLGIGAVCPLYKKSKIN